MKFFDKEIEKFYYKLTNNENFALARFGDGEMIALRGETISSGYGEWITNGQQPEYTIARDLLHKSFTYKDSNYYVGIVCPCCQGIDNFNNMKLQSKQNEEQLTFANVFVNSNYKYFIEKYIPLFAKKEIILIANNKSNIKNLPFSGQFMGVEYNAWIKNLDIINYIKQINHTNKVFLFACGPLGKIVTQQLWEHNKNNTYLDIGSTLHPWLGSDINIRSYYQTNSYHSNLNCYWGI